MIDPAILPDDFENMTFGMSLAPDGSAVAMIRSGPTQQRVIIDLAAGEVASAPMMGFWPPGSSWAADSSGVFDVRADGPGVQFVTQTGETLTFGEQLGRVTALGVRWPDAELEPTTAVVSQPVTAARPLGPTGLRLVGATTGGAMTSIDVDAGVAESWATTERTAGDLNLIASGDMILAFGDGDDPAFAFRRGVQERLADVFATDGVKLPGPTDDTIWVPALELAATANGVAYRLVTIDGMPVDRAGATIDLPNATLLGSDGRGGLVVTRAGDVFAVGVDGTERLTTGELIAIGASTIYVRKCGDVTTCELVRIDRRSGDRTPSFNGFEPALSAPTRGRQATLGTSISPDGGVLLVRLGMTGIGSVPATTDVDQWHLADTELGTLTPIENFDPSQPVIWNADSTFAALRADSGMFVFDRAAGELVALTTDRLRAIGPTPPGWAVGAGT